MSVLNDCCHLYCGDGLIAVMKTHELGNNKKSLWYFQLENN